ncbi:DNA-directed RNA polymerase III subunit RPC5, putative [Plasmodium malariae]|uniref:DNA-directed RNA polymerase III subunit RPC5, putative n=1 Tax=Plasmodium malariae TaxID=5858 RepID=A0A1C3L1D5_PLAMA|nr:DNA-directed RNA polymerase III subunit RPC5, putative [Plasmodium malariae]
MNEDLKDLSKYEYREETDSNSRTSNSDEEEIEEEIDIYLNNVNENNLNNIYTYLIQYPLRPKYRPYNFTNNIQKIYKCKNYNKLRNIKNNFNTNEETYIFEYKLHEHMKEEDIHESNTTYKEEQNDKSISRLISTSVLCEYITNCVCIFKYNDIKKKKEIYMIPLKHIYQFKPCHDNIKFDINFEEKIKTSESLSADNLKDSNIDIIENNKYINDNNFTNSMDDRWSKIVNIYEPDSYEANEIVSLFTNLNETNCMFEYQSNGDDTAKNTCVSSSISSSNGRSKDDIKEIRFNSDAYLYLNHICKNAKEDNYNHIQNDESSKERRAKECSKYNNIYKQEEDICMNINMLYFFSLNLDEQILKILRMKNVQSFSEIQKIIKKNVDDEKLISTVKKYCVNVLGLWVIKSKYLYKFLKGKEKKSEHEKKLETFSYVDYKIRVRDLLLVIIFKQVEPILLKYVYERRVENRSKNMQIKSDYSCSNNNNNSISSTVGSIGSSADSSVSGSSKKINSSTSIIIENFEKATNLSNNILLEMFSPLCEYKYTGYFFKHKMDEHFLANNISLCLFYNEKWKKKMVKVAKIIQTYKNSKIIINDYKLDIRTLEKNITDLLHNNCLSFDDLYNKIKRELRNTNLDLQIFLQVLNNIAININNIWFLRINNQNDFNKCRNAVINIYQNNHNSVLTKKDIIHHVETYIKSSLTIPDIYFRNILNELCVQKNGKYLFKGNDQLKSEYSE